MSHRTLYVLFAFAAVGCLEDGRSEDEYLADYQRFESHAGIVDVGSPVSTDDAVVVSRVELDACSSAPPADPPFVTLVNTSDEIVVVNQILPDCSEKSYKQVQVASRIGVDVWPGVVYRLRTPDDEYLLDLLGADAPYPEELEVP